MEVDLAELIDMGVDSLRQPLLVVLQEVDEESSAAGDVELTAELVGWLLVHLANEVEEKLDDVCPESLELRFSSGES